MRRLSASKWVLLVSAVIVALAVGLVAQEPRPDAPAASGKQRQKIRVRVQKLPAMSVIARPVAGSYDRHPALIQQLLTRANRLGIREAPQGNLIGIYPMDPDAMDRQDNLQWYLALEAPPGTVQAKMAVSPGMLPSGLKADFGTLEAGFARLAQPATTTETYQMAALEPSLALTAEGSYEAVPVVGLVMKEAMYEQGFVQTAPTRTVLLSGDPATPIDDQIQIIFPVAERPGELAGQISRLAVQERGGATARAAAPAGAQVVEIQVQRVPQQSVVVRNMTGAMGIAKSNDVCSEAVQEAGVAAAARSRVTCTRIDIVDPDAAVGSPEKLEWRLAVAAPSTVSLKPGKSLRASKLPSTLAVTRETTADRVHVERQAINAWIVRAGYVHSGPTRTELLAGGSKVRLVIPVKPRARQIPIEFAEYELVRE